MSAGFDFIVSIGPSELIAAAVILPVVGLVTISLRYFVRFSRKVYFGVDDWLLIPALLAVRGMGVCLLIGEFVLKPFDFPVKIGRGKKMHLAIHPRHQIQLQWKLFEWTVTFFFLFIFNCGRHVSGFVTNVLLIIAPIPSILRLRLMTSVKFQVLRILLLAFSALTASIVRLILIFQMLELLYLEKTSILSTNSTLFYWTMIEAGIALIACCLPTLKPLVIGRRLSSVIASVRGVISLPSVRSQGSQNSKSWPTTHAANGIYTKMDKDTPVAIPLKTMQSYGSRDPSGENVVGTTEP